MKMLNYYIRTALFCALLGLVSFGFTSQSAKAAPTAWLVPIGGCCFEVHYAIPPAEANTWISMRVIAAPDVVTAATAVGMFMVSAPGGPSVVYTHGGAGWFPTGPNLYVGTVCFSTVGPRVIVIRFRDAAGNIVNIPFQINCGLIGGGGGLIAPMGGSISTDGGVTTSSGISLASSTESITDNKLADITPNPTSDNATVSLALANDMDNVALYVADMTGRKMLDITSGQHLTMGTHSFSVETQNLSSGVYYVVVKSGQFTQAKMLQVIK